MQVILAQMQHKLLEGESLQPEDSATATGFEDVLRRQFLTKAQYL